MVEYIITILYLQLNELIIGNVDGVLAIFKGDKQNKPWKKCSELGTVCLVCPTVYLSYDRFWTMLVR